MTNNRRNQLLIGVVLAALPIPVFADGLRIMQIMYDPPGSNTGHQWVQIANTGAETIDITKYKLFQNGVNHGLTLIQGSTLLGAGSVAVMTSKPDTFLADNPGYADALFKTSFTLRVAGDTLALKDAKLNILDSTAYTSANGGSEDGNALYRVGEAWVAGAPDPGAYRATPPAAPKAKPVPPQPLSAKSSAIAERKPAIAKAASVSKSVIPVQDEPAATAPPSNTALAAAAARDAGITAPAERRASLLLQLGAGAGALCVIIVASMLLSSRVAVAPVPAPNKEQYPADRELSEADEYEIVESTGRAG